MFRVITVATVALLFSGCMYSQLKTNSAQPRNTRQDETKQDDKKDPLLNPKLATEKAPDKFRVKFETTAGDFVMEVNREWSPNGADRFYNLVKIGYFKDIAIFRGIKGFMFQFGVHGDPKVSAQWRKARIRDDDSKDGISNQEGYISFATSGPHSRTTQMFVNLGDNVRLDSIGFTPFGKVVEGMDVAKKVHTDYGDNFEGFQRKFQKGGNKYVKEVYPKIDYIKSVSFVKEKKDDK